MKNLKMLLSLSLFTLLFTFAMSCKHNHEHAEQAENSEKVSVDKSGEEYSSAYVCPMHCEGSGSEEPGNCPVCGMDYVQNEDHKEDGHTHDGDEHEGHNH